MSASNRDARPFHGLTSSESAYVDQCGMTTSGLGSNLVVPALKRPDFR